MVFEVTINVEGFEGALDLLVERVRRFEINILEMKLSEVAGEVSEKMGGSADPSSFGPFVTIAKLLHIKSKMMLPGFNPFEENEDFEIETNENDMDQPTRVRERLVEQYEMFKSIREWMKEKSDESALSVRSSVTREGEMPDFISEIIYIEDVTPFDVMYCMVEILKRANEDRTYHVKAEEGKRLTDRIAEVFDFLLNRMDPVRFGDLISDKAQRSESTLSFLAVVYLVSQGKIIARQKNSYGDIIITVKNRECA